MAAELGAGKGQGETLTVGRNIVETIVGALVLVVAGVFVFYAFAKSDRTGSDGYELVARFGRIDALINDAGIVPHFNWGIPRWPRRWRATRRRRQYSTPNIPSAKPVRHIHSHQVMLATATRLPSMMVRM